MRHARTAIREAFVELLQGKTLVGNGNITGIPQEAKNIILTILNMPGKILSIGGAINTKTLTAALPIGNLN